jgi:hypothetical protein
MTMNHPANTSLLDIGRVDHFGEPTSSPLGDDFYANCCMFDGATFHNTLSTGKPMMNDGQWEILMSEVRAQLRASNSNVRYCRATELQLLANSEVVSGVHHNSYPLDLVYPMDLVAISQPVHEAAMKYTVTSFVPISPMRSSRFAIPSTTSMTSLPIQSTSKSNKGDGNHSLSSPMLCIQPSTHSTTMAEQWKGNDILNRSATSKLDSSVSNQSIVPHRKKAKSKPRKPSKTTPKRKTQLLIKEVPQPEIIPSKYDVLSGRGGAINVHEGNVWFRDEARKLRKDYRGSHATRDDKMLISQVRNVSIVCSSFMPTDHSLALNPHIYALRSVVSCWFQTGTCAESQRSWWSILGQRQ